MSDLLDPTSSTSAAFNRKAFVGLSAGAAAAVSTVAPSLAGSAAYGKPHPPIVAETDPAIIARPVTLARPDGQIDAYAAWPAHLATTTPGVVMVQHIWGVDSAIRDDVRRYAKAGYICIAPNLYARAKAPSGDGTSDIDQFRPLAAALQDDVVAGDLLAAHGWIVDKAAHGKIGITGFCMGGGIALRQLIGTSTYAAASIFYGPVRPKNESGDQFAYAANINTPVRGNYGERDTSIAPADVQRVFDNLAGPHELRLYPEAGHAFFDDTRASYVDTAAVDAWTKTLAWFTRYLA